MHASPRSTQPATLRGEPVKSCRIHQTSFHAVPTYFLPTSYLLPTYFLTSLGHLVPPGLFKKPLGPNALRAGGFRMWRRGGSFRDPSDELVGGGVDLFVEC